MTSWKPTRYCKLKLSNTIKTRILRSSWFKNCRMTLISTWTKRHNWNSKRTITRKINMFLRSLTMLSSQVRSRIQSSEFEALRKRTLSKSWSHMWRVTISFREGRRVRVKVHTFRGITNVKTELQQPMIMVDTKFNHNQVVEDSQATDMVRGKPNSRGLSSPIRLRPQLKKGANLTCLLTNTAKKMTVVLWGSTSCRRN